MKLRDEFVKSRSRQEANPAYANSEVLIARGTNNISSLREQAQIEWLIAGLNNRASNNPQGFGESLELALGSRADIPTLNLLTDRALAGDLPLPNIRFVGEGSLGEGALGAYDARNGGTILLDNSLLADSSALERVFLEEVGHHLDAQFGAGDATGDEGAIFAKSLLGESLTVAQLSSLRAENDHGTVQLDGNLVDVEFSYGSDTPGGSPEGIGGNDSGVGSSSSSTDSYSDNDHDDYRPSTHPAPQPEDTQTEELLGPVYEAPITDPIGNLLEELNGGPVETLLGPVSNDSPGTTGNGGSDEPETETATGVAAAGAASWAARPGFWGSIGSGLSSFFSFVGLGTVTTGVGLLFGALFPSSMGIRSQAHTIAGSDATIQINPDSLQGTVYINGVETTISVVATTVDANGNPTGFAPATPADAENLSTLGVDISDPSGVIDTSPLNAENTSEGNGVETTIEPKIEEQMGQRGWDEETLENTIENPTETHQVRDTRWNTDGTRRDDPATAYVDNEGHYVVRNDENGTVVQVSDRNDPDWQAPWDKQ